MSGLYSQGAPLRVVEEEPDVDPMSSVANIADAMLVFACGLMVALAVAWNVDLEAVQQVELGESQEIDDVTTLQDILSADGSSYVQRGTVYQDPRTGTMYLVEGDSEGQDAGSGADTDEASASSGVTSEGGGA